MALRWRPLDALNHLPPRIDGKCDGAVRIKRPQRPYQRSIPLPDKVRQREAKFGMAPRDTHDEVHALGKQLLLRCKIPCHSTSGKLVLFLRADRTPAERIPVGAKISFKRKAMCNVGAILDQNAAISLSPSLPASCLPKLAQADEAAGLAAESDRHRGGLDMDSHSVESQISMPMRNRDLLFIKMRDPLGDGPAINRVDSLDHGPAKQLFFRLRPEQRQRRLVQIFETALGNGKLGFR